MEKINLLKDMLLEVNLETGDFDNIIAYSIDKFDEMVSGIEPYDLALKLHFGDFVPHYSLFRFNGYGNIESLCENEYDQEMLDYETEIVQNYVYLFGESDLYLDYLELEKEQ